MRRILIVALAVAALGMSALSYREVQARQVEAQISDVCGQIPGLIAALSYTTQRWPITAQVPSVGGADFTGNMVYFWGAVQNDQGWCDRGGAGQYNPDLVRNTLLWNFGNASQALVQYQAAVQGLPPAGAAPTPTATPIITTSFCNPTIVTAIAGPFWGFADGNVYTFVNGQVWMQQDPTMSRPNSAQTAYAYPNPRATIFQDGSVCRMSIQYPAYPDYQNYRVIVTRQR